MRPIDCDLNYPNQCFGCKEKDILSKAIFSVSKIVKMALWLWTKTIDRDVGISGCKAVSILTKTALWVMPFLLQRTLKFTSESDFASTKTLG